MNYKKILKKILPDFIINLIKKFKISLSNIRYKKMNTYEVFKDVYQKKIWTPNNLKNNFQFFSGIGSHENDFVKTYLQKIEIFLSSLPKKTDVLDLGCGDFTIGSKLRGFFRDYKAIDINDELLSDKEMLEDLIIMAVNDASSKVNQISKDKMKNVTGGLNLPF